MRTKLIGKLIAKLDELRLRNNTVVLLLGDRASEAGLIFSISFAASFFVSVLVRLGGCGSLRTYDVEAFFANTLPCSHGRPCQALFRTSLTLHCDPVSKDPFDLVSLVNQIYGYQRRNQHCKDPNDLMSFGESVSSQVDWPIGAKYANPCQRRMGETRGHDTFFCGLDFQNFVLR